MLLPGLSLSLWTKPLPTPLAHLLGEESFFPHHAVNPALLRSGTFIWYVAGCLLKRNAKSSCSGVLDGSETWWHGATVLSQGNFALMQESLCPFSPQTRTERIGSDSFPD